MDSRSHDAGRAHRATHADWRQNRTLRAKRVASVHQGATGRTTALAAAEDRLIPVRRESIRERRPMSRFTSRNGHTAPNYPFSIQEHHSYPYENKVYIDFCSGFEPVGREFESLRARHLIPSNPNRSLSSPSVGEFAVAPSGRGSQLQQYRDASTRGSSGA